MEFELSHPVAKPADQAFEILTGVEFQAELEARVSFEKALISERETADGWVRVWRIVERGEMPAFVRKIVGSAFEYTIQHTMMRSKRRIAWRVTPAVAADRVTAEGFEGIREGTHPGTALRIVRGKVEVHAPVFGRRLADFIGGEVRKGYEKNQEFIEGYFASHP